MIWWGGRLLALWEGGQPYKLDPLSLGTAGATDLLNVVPKVNQQPNPLNH